jgi:hypothetical protein
MNNLNESYGFKFNEIKIINNCFVKRPKNKYGIYKIKNEINFYNFLNKNKINFPIPKVISTQKNILKLEYLSDYKPLTPFFYKNKKRFLSNIFKNLHSLHNSKNKKITKKEYLNLLYQEIVEKNIKRHAQIKKILPKNISTVNGLAVNSFEYYINQIFKHTSMLIKNQKNFKLVPIHGDTHLGNILYNLKTIKFIDPRGYFGSSSIFGIEEYDYAKLLFGISGYSIFDTCTVSSLKIKSKNITVQINKHHTIYKNAINYGFNNLSILLSLSIWLGNSSMFLNKNKILASYFTSLYLCEKYINTIK